MSSFTLRVTITQRGHGSRNSTSAEPIRACRPVHPNSGCPGSPAVSITSDGRKRSTSMFEPGTAAARAASACVVMIMSGQQSWCAPGGDSYVATSGGNDAKFGNGSDASRPKMPRSSAMTSSESAGPRTKCSRSSPGGSDSMLTRRPSALDNLSCTSASRVFTTDPSGNVRATWCDPSSSGSAANCISSPIFFAPRMPPRSWSRIAQWRSPAMPSSVSSATSTTPPMNDFTGYRQIWVTRPSPTARIDQIRSSTGSGQMRDRSCHAPSPRRALVPPTWSAPLRAWSSCSSNTRGNRHPS